MLKIQGVTIINDETLYIDFAGNSALKVPSGTTAERTSGVLGQIRYNTSENQLEYYDGALWKSSKRIFRATASAAAPVSPSAGKLWWDSSTATLKIYYVDSNSSQWVDASPTLVGDFLKDEFDPNNYTFTPSGIAPASQDSIAANTTFTLTASAYSNSANTLHASSDWQIATNSTFTSVVEESLSDTGNKTSYPVTGGIANLGTYYWRVRYRDETGSVSNFSTPIEFGVVNPVVQPTGTSPSGGQVINTGTTITLAASAFSVTAGSTTHASSDWQVSTSNTFGTFVNQSLSNTANKTSYSFTTATEGTLFWRVRYRDSAGNVSGYSTPQTFESITPPPSLGDSYCGGFYIGTICAASTCYYIIVAPNASGCALCKWKTVETVSTGTFTVTDGYANTYGPLNNATHPAGNFTATRTIGGFSDWYMPAKNELNQLYVNKGTMPAGEGFAVTNYWSSTERAVNPARAEILNLHSGTEDSNGKTFDTRVRAVRRQPI